MSRHHMLPPITYVPQAKPKKIEPRRSRIQMRGAGSVDGADEAEETFGPDQPAPTGSKPPLQNFAPIEGAEQKPQRPQGRLSESTLTVMLQVQELKEGVP
jgi:hypothetical protein